MNNPPIESPLTQPSSSIDSLSSILSEIFHTDLSGTLLPKLNNPKSIPLLYTQILTESNLQSLHSCLSNLYNLFLPNPHLLLTITPIHNQLLSFNTFITCYLTLIHQEQSEQIISIKHILLNILTLLTTYIDCPKEIFSNIYSKISSFTFKRNSLSSKHNNTNIFKDYIDLLYALYNIGNDKRQYKPMPKRYIINNGTGIEIKLKNEISFQKGLCIMGWLNIKDDGSYDKTDKKYLIIVETLEKSLIEVYITENLNKVYLSYKKEKGVKTKENIIYHTNNTFKEQYWNFFSLQLETEKSQMMLILTIFNFSNFKKPILQDIKLAIPSFKQETISSITLYKNLTCSFTSIIIGHNIRGEKIIKKDCARLLHYGIYDDKILRLIMDTYNLKNEIFNVLCTPYNSKINIETKCIEFEDIFHNASIVLPNINCHYISQEMIFYENNIHSYNNYASRIHFIGGINAFLPLLEIIFTQKEHIDISNELFEKVFLLISKLLTRSKYNFINAIISDFFQALSVFMENFPKKYYTPKICEYLLDIKNFYIKKLQYIDTFFHGKIKRYNVFLEHIFLNEKIIFRFKNHLLHLLWDQIKEIVEGILKYHNTHKESYERRDSLKNKQQLQSIYITNELEYEHINYILTYEKLMSILMYFESKTLHKHCCEKHSMVIYKKKQYKQEGYLQPPLMKIIEPIENILCTLINIESLFQKKNLLQLFKMLPLDISPCLKMFLIRLLPPLIVCSTFNDGIDIIEELKEYNLMTFLTISLGGATLSEKVTILQTIVSIDKENYIDWFDSKKEICPIIKDLIPNLSIKNEETMPQVSNRLLSENFNARSDFYEFYLKYKPFMLIDFYDFPQWISFFYPQQHIENEKYCNNETIKIFRIIFDWLDFWIEMIHESGNNEKISSKKNAIFELLINYVIRIKKLNILIEFLTVCENYFQKANNEGKSQCINELTGCQVFWLFILEHYYYCYRIINTQTQETLIGKDKWFIEGTSIQYVDTILHDICTKCNNIIQEMVKCILIQENNIINLYYILTWGTYQKILYQSTSIGIQSKDKSIITLSQFMHIIIEIYFNSLKINDNNIDYYSKGVTYFISTVLNIIYDFVIIFPLGTNIILDPCDLFENQKRNIFYIPCFFLNQSNRIKEYSSIFNNVILFILDLCDVESIFFLENKNKLNECSNEQKISKLDNIADNYIYNKHYYDCFYNKLIFLTKTESIEKNSIDVNLTYLSFPISKLIMHFLCCLSSFNEENNLTFISLIEVYIINLIIMTTCQNNKKSKNISSPFLKEINKTIEPILLLGISFLIDQYRFQETNKQKYLQPLINIVYFIKKILSNKNSPLITQSPIYNIFINIIQDANKQPFISLQSSLHDLNDNFFNNTDWDMLIYKNKSVIDVIGDYFGKEETLNHLMRIHCEIKEIIPIVNNVNPSDIVSKSNADVFKIETNVNLAVCDEKMNRNTMWEIEKTKIKKVFDIVLDKIEKDIYLTCQHNKKIYKNIKKDLFSWNNVWSDKNIFYVHSELLLQKQLYHLTKEYTTPLLVPILDIDIYLPSFKLFNKSNLFLKDINDISNYGISLDIENMVSLIKDKKSPIIKNKHISKIKSKLPKNYSQETILDNINTNACMIKQTHHIPGIISIENNVIVFEINYNDEGTGIEENNLLYDKENKTCFGSFFKNYRKDKLKSFIKIPFNKINMIIKRKYYYCNNAFEIFTENNKSYYFHLRSHQQRKKFFEEIKQNKDFKIILRNCHKKDTYELLYISKKYQTKIGFKGLSFIEYIEHWASNHISNVEFLMFCNILAGRSLRDLTQYPVFPWTLIDYNSKELILKCSNFRQFSLPMGMMNINPEAKKRKELFIQEYEQMKSEIQEDKRQKESNENEVEQEEITSEGNSIETIGKNEKNINFDLFQSYPYYYGTHYSNPLYVSHYLSRIFPFSQLRIELQGDNFDSSRMFSSINQTFISATTQKTDVRELIPEFFVLPEMFININNLNLGIPNMDVALPEWSNNKPYLFIKQMRKSIEYREDKYDNGIHRWLDLIIGNLRTENHAKTAGNIYMYHTYTSLVPLDKYKSREDLNDDTLFSINYYLRLAELGLTPNFLFYDELPPKDNRILKSIVLSTDLEIKENKVKKLTDFFNGNKLKYLAFQQKDFQIYAISNKNEFYNFNTNILTTTEDRKISKDTSILSILKSNIYSPKTFSLFQKYPILINQYLIIHGGFNDCSLLFHNRTNDTNEIITNSYDNSTITVLVTDKHEQYIYCGTQHGSILIFYIHYIHQQSEHVSDIQKIFIKKKKDSKKVELMFKTCLSHHNKEITAITINDELEICGSTAKDGYVNLYIIPSFKYIRSVKLSTIPYSDFLFISNTPVPCFVLFHEKQFVSYSINGSSIEFEKMYQYKKETKCEEELEFMKDYEMTSYYFLTDLKTYGQYLIIGTSNGFIHIREFPEMKLYSYIKVYDDCSVDALISLGPANNEFLIYTKCDKANPRYKIIHNTKASSENLVFSCSFQL